MTERLTFWDYTHMPIQKLVKHPDYSLARFTRVMEALGEAKAIIEAHEDRFNGAA